MSVYGTSALGGVDLSKSVQDRLVELITVQL